MFALEMLLKLAAFGLFDYLRNPYNIFDSIIVIIRCCPCCQRAGGPEAEWGGGRGNLVPCPPPVNKACPGTKEINCAETQFSNIYKFVLQ